VVVVLDAEVRQQAEQEDHGNRHDDDQVQGAAAASAGATRSAIMIMTPAHRLQVENVAWNL
jgi:hypothetical protein